MLFQDGNKISSKAISEIDFVSMYVCSHVSSVRRQTGMDWWISHHWRHVPKFSLLSMRADNMEIQISLRSADFTVQMMCNSLKQRATATASSQPLTVIICSMQGFTTKKHVRSIRLCIFKNGVVPVEATVYTPLSQYKYRSRQKIFFMRCSHSMQENS